MRTKTLAAIVTAAATLALVLAMSSFALAATLDPPSLPPAGKPFGVSLTVAPPTVTGHVDMTIYQLRRGHWRGFMSFRMGSADGSRVKTFSGSSLRLPRGTFKLSTVYAGSDFLTTGSESTIAVR